MRCSVLVWLTSSPKTWIAKRFELEVPEDEIEELVAERNRARAAKDFVSSDRLRDRLATLGVIVEDAPESTPRGAGRDAPAAGRAGARPRTSSGGECWA